MRSRGFPINSFYFIALNDSGWEVRETGTPQQVSNTWRLTIYFLGFHARTSSIAFFWILWQISKLVSEIIEPRRITCDTALKSWRSIFSMQKFFTPLKIFYTPFFHMPKFFLGIFEKVAIFNSCKKKGGKKLLREVKNLFIEKFEHSAFQRRVARYFTRLSYFWKFHWIRNIFKIEGWFSKMKK